MMHKVTGYAAVLLLTLVGAASGENKGAAKTEGPADLHYPYDPACAWGRIADGRGMLIRCLNEAEAQALSRAPELTARSPAPSPTNDGPEPTAPPEGAVAAPGNLKAEVVSVTADQGKLPEGARKLSTAESRFVECVAKHGGLSAPSGEVHVRFLVRQRGRAEGVSVSKRRALSEEAARCVADVVDRRAVGLPEAPMVGATVVIKFARSGS